MFYVKSIRSNTARIATVAALSATLFFGAALANDAHAGDRGKQKARAGQAQGAQWSRVTTAQRTPNGRTSQSTVTRGDGKVATRDAVVVNDRAAGTRSVDATTTGFNGRTTTYSSDAQRTETGYTRDVSRTLPDGQVNQHGVDVSCDKALQSCTKVVTGQNGG
jgi:hypothetical protein